MSGNEEVLFNVVGDVSEAVSALNEWISAIDNVTKSFDALASSIQGLDEKLGGLAGTIDGLVQSFASLDQAASGAGETLGGIDEALTAANEAIATLAQEASDGAAGAGDLASGLTTLDEVASTVAESLDTISQSLSAMQDSTATAIDELSQLGPEGNAAAAALINLDDALANAATELTGLGDDAAGVDNIINGLAGPISTVNQALSALSDEAAGPAQAAFMGLLDAWDGALGAASSLSAAMDAAAQSATQAAVAAVNAGDAAAGEAGGLQAGATAAQALADAQITASEGAAFLKQNAAQAQDTLVQGSSAVQNATQGFANFGSVLNNVGSFIDGIVSKIQELNGQLLELAADETAAGDAEKATEPGMSGDAYMLMMLIPMIQQAAGSFLQLGMAAEDSIAKITGMADQSLQGAAGLSRLDSVVQALSQDTLQFGGTLADTANGMYFIISEGFKGGDALTVLNVAMEAAGATGVKFQAVATALTSVMNAYGKSAGDAKQVQDQLIAAVVSGAQTYDTFANAIGKTAAQGKAAGFSLREVLAAESAMTQINPSVRQDTANLGNLMAVLHNNMDKTAASAKGLGLQFSEQKYASMDLVERLQYLLNVTHGNWTEMRALLGNATATNAAFYILANGGKNVAAALQAQTDAAGSLDRAFQSTSQTINFALSRISGALSVMSYKLIVAIGPVITPLFNNFANLLGALAAHTEILIPVLTGLAVVLGVILVAAISAVVGMFSLILTAVLPVAIALGAIGAAAAILIPKILAVINSGTQLGSALRATEFQVKSAAEAIKTAFAGAITALHPLLQGLATIFNTVVVPAFAAFAGGAAQSFAGIMRQIAAAIQGATPHILAFGNYVKNNIAPALQAAMPHITEFATQLGRWLPVILPVVAGLLGFRGVISGVMGVLGVFRGGLSALGTVFNVVKGGVTFVSDAFKLLGIGVVGSIEGISSFITNFRGIATVIMGVFRASWLWLQGAFSMIGPFIADAGGPLQALFAVVRGGAAVVSGFVGDLIALINPVTLIAAAVIALTALLIMWLTTTKQGQQVLAALGAMFMSLWNILVANLKPAWASLQQSLTLIWTSMQQLWTAIQPLIPPLEKLAAIMGGIFLVAIVVAISAIVGIITALANFVAGLVNVIAHVIQFVTGIIQAFSGMWNMIKGLFTNNSQLEQQGWNQFVQGIENIWNGFTGAIIGVFKTCINTILGLGKGFFSALTGMFSSFANALVHHSIWPDMWDAVSANTAQNTSKVHSQIQTFSTQTTATFTQMSANTVQANTAMWQHMQTQIAAAMSASTTVVKTGLAAINTQITTSGNLILQSVQKTWTQVSKDISQNLTAMVSLVNKDFTTMDTDMTKSLTKMESDNQKAWTQMEKDETTQLNLMESQIKTSFTNIQKTFTTTIQNLIAYNTQQWNKLYQDTKTNWQLVVNEYVTNWQLIYDDTKTALTNIYQLYTQQWALQIAQLKTNLTTETTTWKTFWTTLIAQDQTNWKTLQTDAVTGMTNINNAVKTGTTQIESTITTFINWIAGQMKTLDSNATTWGTDFAKNFAAGIRSQIGAIQAAASAAAAAAKAPLGHSKPSEGPMADDDMWGVHFMENFAAGIRSGIPLVQQAAQNAASVISATMPTAQNLANATSTGSNSALNGSEHLAVLKQILAQLKQMSNGGGANTFVGGSTSIGYNIPSTQLGSIVQQFSSNSLRLSPSDIANIYQQLNTLQGLSAEYGARGATTGVGF